MTADDARFYFDYVDPLSYLLDIELRAVEEHSGRRVRRIALELRAPPSPLIDPHTGSWLERREQAVRIARGSRTVLAEPALVPWTRKAHELLRHAEAHGSGPAAHEALFDAYQREGQDIGRVDVLVRLARLIGLDGTEAKAVLDVDRYAADVDEARRAALADGIDRIPTLVAGPDRIEGFQNRTALSTFLHL